MFDGSRINQVNMKVIFINQSFRNNAGSRSGVRLKCSVQASSGPHLCANVDIYLCEFTLKLLKDHTPMKNIEGSVLPPSGETWEV